MNDNLLTRHKPTCAINKGLPCNCAALHPVRSEPGSAVRFSLDPESGFVRDHAAGEWLTTAEEVFDAMFPMLPNAGVRGDRLAGVPCTGVVGPEIKGA
jgi:hypothetical protein